MNTPAAIVRQISFITRFSLSLLSVITYFYSPGIPIRCPDVHRRFVFECKFTVDERWEMTTIITWNEIWRKLSFRYSINFHHRFLAHGSCFPRLVSHVKTNYFRRSRKASNGRGKRLNINAVNQSIGEITVEYVIQRDSRFRYMLLSRLQSDCRYYLGYGNRSPRYLWAGDETEQIEFMTKTLWQF